MKPACESAVTMSQGYSPCRSIAAARGAITSRANARARACNASSPALSPCVMEGLCQILPAVRRQRRAGDEPGVVGGEEHHAARDLFRLAETAERNLRDDVLLKHVLRHGLHHLGVDVAGTDRVDGDPALGALLRERLGEADLAGLGGGIVRLSHLALLAVDRGDVD